MPAPERTALNESQQRNLIITCQHVDRLLADLEQAFVEARSNSPFGRYVNDLAPAEQRLVQDYLARIRTQLVRVLTGQGLPPTPRQTGVRWSILTHLAYVDVAIEELKPHYMRGYGAVAPEASAALNGIVEELHGAIAQLTRYLSVDRSEDLHARLQRIRTGPDIALLKTLEELIAKYGLVECRSGLGTILATLERRGLELAVFGRVSTGKSSLLNRLLGGDVLPVGVTPITAVPTRIAFGRDARLHVWFADAPSRQLDVGVLAEYASERGNPANTKRVLRLVVELPAPFLESGVTLVDTPGLGSLATSGAAETLAYLPHCDVAAVLVDASSTISSEDLGTVGALLDAGVRASVLVSKADLLSETDLEATLAYLRQTLSREFTASIPVAAVSVKPAFDRLFEEWRESELVPLIADQQRQREAAAARKAEILRTQVQTTLRRLAQGGQPDGAEASVSEESRTSDSALQTAAGEIVVLERRIDDVTVVLPRRADEVLSRAADSIDRQADPQRALDQAFRQVAGDTARELSSQLPALVAALVQACRRVSSAAQWIGECDDAADAEKRFREVPIPALPPEIRVPSQGAERVLGHAVARSITVKRLERAVGPAIRSTLQDYAAVLRRWGLDSLNQIRAEWAATTDAVRADLDRQLGHGRAVTIGPEEVARDLERLSAVVVR
jgi:GTP-binding protein EngB required for normal cell division